MSTTQNTIDKIKEYILLKLKMRKVRRYSFIARQYILRQVKLSYNERILEVKLKGGLCNKLMCLFSACDIAIKQNATILEPIFGWKEKILFSDIYDLDYFNKSMAKYNNGKDIIVSREQIRRYPALKKRFRFNYIDLWTYEYDTIKEQNNRIVLDKDSMRLKVLRALKLKREHSQVVDEFTDIKEKAALQVRIESDWVKYNTHKKVEKDEILLISVDDLFPMIKSFGIQEFFFTSGENQEMILSKSKEYGFESYYFFNPAFEYEINAAINFELCCKAKSFIGLSRSTYSGLITLKRSALLSNENNYIYNFDNKILKRIDKGIQMVAELSVTKETIIS